MNSETAVACVAGALEELGLKYLLVGAFAYNAYGVPRATNDADFVLAAEPGQLTALANRLGPDFRLDPQTIF